MKPVPERFGLLLIFVQFHQKPKNAQSNDHAVNNSAISPNSPKSGAAAFAHHPWYKKHETTGEPPAAFGKSYLRVKKANANLDLRSTRGLLNFRAAKLLAGTKIAPR